MWIVWAFVIPAVALWLGYYWLTSLTTKYSHTKQSLFVLAALAFLSVAGGRKISSQVAPQWGLGPALGASLAIGFVLFSVLSFLVINLWLALLAREYDDSIAKLEEEEEKILRQLEIARWQALRTEAGQVTGAEAQKVPKGQDEELRLSQLVDAWEQEGGAARIRSLKVLEWKSEIAQLSDEELKREIHEHTPIAGANDIKTEQTRVRAALLQMEALSRAPSVLAEKEAKMEQPKSFDVERDQSAMRRRLQDINKSISATKAAKAEFLGQKVILRWGRRQ